MAAAQNDAAIVIAHEDRIAAQLIQGAIIKRSIIGPLKENGPTPVNRPIAAKQRLLVVHEGAATVTKEKPFEMYVGDRFLQVAAELNQITLLYGLDRGGFQIDVLGRIKVKRPILGVEEPFPGGVEFLKNVLDEAILLMHAGLAIVLPTTFVSNGATGILAGDSVMKIAPHDGVHGMNVTTARVGPAFGSLLAERVRRSAAEVHSRSEEHTSELQSHLN